LYEHQLQDHQVSQTLGEAKIELSKVPAQLAQPFCEKNHPLMSKVLNKSKTCQNGKDTQTS
jgi:hypothetical protein